MTLGEIIKKYRTEHDMSMRDFEALSGISRGYLSMLEKNENPRSKKPITPSIDMIKQVANAIGLTFDQVFDMMDAQEISLAVPSKSTNAALSLSPLEREIILKFRKLTNGERDMFLRSLGIEEKGDVAKMA